MRSHLTVEELLQSLRGSLQPQGTAQIVRIEGGYFHGESIEKAINQLEMLMLTRTPASPLETIGIEVLLATIGYER